MIREDFCKDCMYFYGGECKNTNGYYLYCECCDGVKMSYNCTGKVTDNRPFSRAQKPPVGLRPQSIADVEYKIRRIDEIKKAMWRYINAGFDIPNKWIKEMVELMEKIGD